MRNIKKKVMIAGFFATLMLMVPFTGITAEKQLVETLESQEATMHSEEEFDISKILCMIGDNTLGLLVLEILDLLGLENSENANVEVSEEELNTAIITVMGMDLESLGGTQEMQTVEETGMGTTGSVGLIEEEPGEISGEVLGEVGSQPLPLPPGWKDILLDILKSLINAGWDWLEQVDQLEPPRLGWLNGIINFTVEQHNLRQQLQEDLWPNVTHVEVIEDTLLYVFGIEFSVHDFLFGDEFINFLVNKVDNFTFRIQVFGILQEIYDQYIKPFLIHHIQTGNVSQLIYDYLDQKVYWGQGPLNNVLEKFNSFMNSLRAKRGAERRRGIFRNGTRIIGTIIRVSMAGIGYAVYLTDFGTNDSQLIEYIETVWGSITNYRQCCNDFIVWLSEVPWDEPIIIDGNVTGLDEGEEYNVEISVTGHTVWTNITGSFEGLEYNVRENEKSLWGIHEFNIDATTEGGTQQATVKEYVFSNSHFNRTIDFSENGTGGVVVEEMQEESTQQPLR
jgi:hypothetical protein